MNYKLHGYGVLGSLFRFIWANGFSSIQWAAVTYWTHCTFAFWIIKWFLWFYSILAPFPGILAMRRNLFLFLSMAFSLAPSGKHEWHSFQFSLITNSYYSKLKSFCIEHFTVDIYHAHASYKQWTVNTVHCELQFVMTFTICVYAVFFYSSSSSSWSLLLLLLQCSWEKRMPNVFIRFEYRKLNAWKAYAICQCGVCNTQSKK